MSLAALIAAAVLATSTLSGIFGMGGGMILMGIYVLAMPVASAMILHGITQLGANGFRAFLLRRHIHWPIVVRIGLGGLAALALFTGLQIAASKAVVLIALGALPLAVLLIPARRLPLSIESPAQAVGCGVLFVGVQLIAGASGPIIDAFFLRGELGRHRIVATKAMIGVTGHVAKLLYWGALLRASNGSEIPAWIAVLAVACAFAGTRIGKGILGRVSEIQFRRGSAALVLAISSFYLLQGLWALGS